MIRANFHIDPTALTDDQWSMLFQQAVWIENFRLSNTAKILAQLFAPTNDS